MPELFDKVKQSVEKGISAVSLKSREAVDSLKVKMQIETLTGEIQDATTALGEAVYQMSIQQNLDQEIIQQKCAAISLLKQQLQEKEAELEEIRVTTGTALGKLYCSQCKAELPENAQYCAQCGKKVE